MNILILEDEENRIKFFKNFFKNQSLFFFDDIEEAYNYCSKNKINKFFIDNDLGEKIGNSGYEFTKRIVKNKLHKNAEFYIHSMNVIAVKNIVTLLQENNYTVYMIPFYLLASTYQK